MDQNCNLMGNVTIKNRRFRAVPFFCIYIYIYVWVNYNDFTATSLEIMVNKGNHPQMALFQVCEIL